MLPLSLQIAAHVVGPVRARQPLGIGRVQSVVDQNTVVLRVRAQDVTVRLQEGALSVGDTVRIQQDGDRVLLEKIAIPVDSQRPLPSPVDSWNVDARPRAAASAPVSAGPATSQTVFVASDASTSALVRNGILLFENGAQARQWLSDNGFARGVDATATIPPALELQTPVAVRTFPFEQAQTGAVALAAKDAVAEFRHIVTQGLQSTALQSIPPEVFMQVLSDRGAVSVDRLIAIDRALLAQPSVNAPVPPVAAPVPQRAQTDAMVQWLNVALDADVQAAALPVPPTAISAGELLRDAQSVVTAARNLGAPTPAVISAVLEVPQSASTATDAIVTAARGLGLTLEADLLRVVNNGSPLPMESLASLKVALVRIDNWIGTALSTGAAVATPNAPTPGLLGDLLVRYVFGFGTLGMQAIDSATEAVGRASGSPVSAQLLSARQDLVALLPQLTAMLDQSDALTPERLKVAVGQYMAAHPQLLSAVPSGAQLADSGDVDTADAVRTAGLLVQRALASLVDATRVAVSRVGAEVSAQQSQTHALLSSTAEDVGALVGAVSRAIAPRITSLVEELRNSLVAETDLDVARRAAPTTAAALSPVDRAGSSGGSAASLLQPAQDSAFVRIADMLRTTLQSRLDDVLSSVMQRASEAAQKSSAASSVDQVTRTVATPSATGLGAASDALTRAVVALREQLTFAQTALRAAVPALIASAVKDVLGSVEQLVQQSAAVRGGAEAPVDAAGRPSWVRLDSAGTGGSGSPAASVASTRVEQVLREAVAQVLAQLDMQIARLDKHQSASAAAYQRVAADAFAQQADALPAPARETPDAGTLTQRMALESVRQNVEQVLGRLESLQVLGKQVSTPDGQQQIIALPVKIRDEVTEVRVKLVKREGHERKDGKPGRYTASLDVSPSCVGDVSAFMEYFPGKNFRLRLELGQDASRSWFERNKSQLAGALEALGLHGVQVDVVRLPTPTVASALPVHGVAGESRPGRVDVHA